MFTVPVLSLFACCLLGFPILIFQLSLLIISTIKKNSFFSSDNFLSLFIFVWSLRNSITKIESSFIPVTDIRNYRPEPFVKDTKKNYAILQKTLLSGLDRMRHGAERPRASLVYTCFRFNIRLQLSTFVSLLHPFIFFLFFWSINFWSLDSKRGNEFLFEGRIGSWKLPRKLLLMHWVVDFILCCHRKTQARTELILGSY